MIGVSRAGRVRNGVDNGSKPLESRCTCPGVPLLYLKENMYVCICVYKGEVVAIVPRTTGTAASIMGGTSP